MSISSTPVATSVAISREKRRMMDTVMVMFMNPMMNEKCVAQYQHMVVLAGWCPLPYWLWEDRILINCTTQDILLGDIIWINNLDTPRILDTLVRKIITNR